MNEKAPAPGEREGTGCNQIQDILNSCFVGGCVPVTMPQAAGPTQSPFLTKTRITIDLCAGLGRSRSALGPAGMGASPAAGFTPARGWAQSSGSPPVQIGAGGWPGKLRLVARGHSTLDRTGQLMASTYFASDPKLLQCLVLGPDAKAPRLGLALAALFLQQSHLGLFMACTQPSHPAVRLATGFPCTKITVTLQTSMLSGLCPPGMLPSTSTGNAGSSHLYLVAASIPGNDTAPSCGQEKHHPSPPETLQLPCLTATISTHLLQAEVTSGSHTG